MERSMVGSQLASASNSNAANNLQQSTKQFVSVNDHADRCLEASAQARYFAENFLCDLKQMNGAESNGQPCRLGLDGKMIDAEEHSVTTLTILQEIRRYLLG